MRREEPGGHGLGRQVGIDAEHDVGLASLALQLDARQKRCTIAGGDKVQVTRARLFEGRLDGRAWAPFRHEAVIGDDSQFWQAPCRGSASCHDKSCTKAWNSHLSLLVSGRGKG